MDLHHSIAVDLQPARQPSAKRAITERSAPLSGPSRPASRVVYWGLGIFGFAIVIVLRYAGLLSGFPALLLLLGCLLFGPGPARLTNRLVLAFALVLGWIPLLGWIPGLASRVDLAGTLLALATGLSVARVAKLRHARHRVLPVFGLSDGIAAAAGTATTLWWALPFFRLTGSGRLLFLLPSFDNVAHYSMFRDNLRLGSFGAVNRAIPGGGLRFEWNYPQGLHYAWALGVRLWSPHPPSTVQWTLNAYALMLALTSGLIVMVLGAAVARANREAIAFTLPVIGVILAFFTFGRLWPYNSFPNFNMAVAASVLAVIVALRPFRSPRTTFVVVVGAALIAGYNWLPMALLSSGAVVVAAVDLYRREPRVTEPGRTLLLGVSAVAFLACASLVVGSTTVVSKANGGFLEAPWTLLLLSVAGLIVFVLTRRDGKMTREGILLLSVPLLGAGMTVLLVSYQLLTTRYAHYYAQKLATGVADVCALVLATVLAARLASRPKVAQRSRLTVTTIVILTTLGGLQLDGFVGPFAHGLMPKNTNQGTVAVANGVLWHRTLSRASLGSADMSAMVTALQRIHGLDASRPGELSRWYYVDPTQPAAIASYWFTVLNGFPTEHAIANDAKLAYLNGGTALGREIAVSTIMDVFGLADESGSHLIVPGWLYTDLQRSGPGWRSPGALWTVGQVLRLDATPS